LFSVEFSINVEEIFPRKPKASVSAGNIFVDMVESAGGYVYPSLDYLHTSLTILGVGLSSLRIETYSKSFLIFLEIRGISRNIVMVKDILK